MFSYPLILFSQCGSRLISIFWAPLPTPLAITIQFVFVWLFSLMQGVFIALSITRIFLILKVNKSSRQELNLDNQPIEFNQLDHERSFKLVLVAIFGAITIYVISVLGFTHSVETGNYEKSKYKVMFFCFREAISFGTAHGCSEVSKVSCDSFFPSHFQRSNCPVCDWI